MKSPLFIPLIAVVLTLVLLGWGFYNSRKHGKLGWLSWLQLVALMFPWLVYFYLFLNGIFINFALLLLLLVVSTVVYTLLGNQIRKVSLGQQSDLLKIKSEKPDASANAGNLQSDAMVLLPSPSIKDDLKLIQGIFGIETFYATETIPYREGVIFKGNLRGEAAHVHQFLSKALRDRFGKKYNLFIVEGQDEKPVVAVLPSTFEQDSDTWPQKILAVVLLVANLSTSVFLSAEISSIELLERPEQFMAIVPFALGLFAILVCRELAQRWIAKKYDIRLSLPFLLPSTQLGSFGSFSRVQSPIPNRQALFELAIAPTIASGILSMGLLVGGLWLTRLQMGSIDVPAQIFQASVLTGALAKIILGEALHVDLVSIHPMVVLGWLGMTISALNLLPAGQLDGGRLIQSIYGRKVAGWATLLTLVFLAVATLVNPLALYWGGIILVLLRDQERPMLDEITELDSDRDALGVVALFWMLIVLLPLTSSVAQRIGIGN